MKPEVSFTYNLSVEDVEKAVRAYINSQGGVVGAGKVTVTPEIIEQPDIVKYPKTGPVFAGLKVTVSEAE